MFIAILVQNYCIFIALINFKIFIPSKAVVIEKRSNVRIPAIIYSSKHIDV